MPAPGGSIRLTASGTILVAGDAVKVYGLEIQSGGTAAVVTMVNGSALTNSPIYYTATGVASKTVGDTTFPSAGIYFPGGLYVSFDANTTAVIVNAEAASTL